jgi:hypothetical protein
LSFSKFSWDPFIPVANDFAALVVAFELLTRDPQVVVPSNVMQTQLFDEQTPAGQLGFHYLSEILLNFWGETAPAIPDQSAQPIEEKNLTNVTAAGIGLIGHYEIHDWYLANVVDANETFTYFG